MNPLESLQEVSIDDILELQQVEIEERTHKEKLRREISERLGLSFNVESIFDAEV